METLCPVCRTRDQFRVVNVPPVGNRVACSACETIFTEPPEFSTRRILDSSRLNSRGRVILCFAAVLGAYALVTYLAFPAVFDRTIGAATGLKANVRLGAEALLERALTDVWHDTASGYDRAAERLRQVHVLDRQNVEAMALLGIVQTFRAHDQQQLGRSILAEGTRVARALGAQSRQEAPEGSKEAQHLSRLKKQVQASIGQSKALFENAGRHGNSASQILKVAMAQFGASPIVQVAHGIHFAYDDEQYLRAAAALSEASALRQAEGLTASRALTGDLWLAYLQGLLLTHRPATRQQALAAFDTALTSRPDFVRAHYMKAETLAAMGRWQEANTIVLSIIKNRPDHQKAAALRRHIRASGRLVAVPKP